MKFSYRMRVYGITIFLALLHRKIMSQVGSPFIHIFYGSECDGKYSTSYRGG